MKNARVLILVGACLAALFVAACGNASTSNDKQNTTAGGDAPAEGGGEAQPRLSPPQLAEVMLGTTKVALNYGAPSVRGRAIWGGLVQYGEVWRTGANEATTFEVSHDVLVNGQKLPAGKYALFTIPDPNEWTVIFNSQAQQWGAYEYDESKDALRVKAKPQPAEMHESLKFSAGQDGVVTMNWEKIQVSFTVAEIK